MASFVRATSELARNRSLPSAALLVARFHQFYLCQRDRRLKGRSHTANDPIDGLNVIVVAPDGSSERAGGQTFRPSFRWVCLRLRVRLRLSL